MDSRASELVTKLQRSPRGEHFGCCGGCPWTTKAANFLPPAIIRIKNSSSTHNTLCGTAKGAIPKLPSLDAVEVKTLGKDPQRVRLDRRSSVSLL